MKHFLSVTACVKNERDYLAEWIAFHRVQGVDHFFLYDNDSDDGTTELLEHLAKLNLVTHQRMSDVPVQFKAYRHSLKHHGKKTKWMAFIDVDEFLVCTAMQLPAFLKGKTRYPGIGVRWVFFGTNGHKEKTPGLVTERFTGRSSVPDKHVKSIVQPELTKDVGNDPHHFLFKRGRAVDEHGNLFPKVYSITPPGTIDLIRINHYHVKSEAEARERWSRYPDPGTNVMRDFNHRFKAHDLNEIQDNSAAKFNLLVKGVMSEWNLKSLS